MKPNPADNPPGVPLVQGTPKSLYTLRYVDIATGTGDPAEPRTILAVRYTGWLTDGTKFDSSDDHPGQEPISFQYGVRRVIAGWDTGFEGMRVGGKRRLYIPYQLAYGTAGKDPIPPKANLIFDVELVSVSSGNAPLPMSGSPSAAPSGSTPSGTPPSPQSTTPPPPKPETTPQR